MTRNEGARHHNGGIMYRGEAADEVNEKYPPAKPDERWCGEGDGPGGHICTRLEGHARNGEGAIHVSRRMSKHHERTPGHQVDTWFTGASRMPESSRDGFFDHLWD